MLNCTLDYMKGVLDHCYCVSRFKKEWELGSGTDDITLRLHVADMLAIYVAWLVSYVA